MKNKNKLRILLMFTIIMAASFIPDHYHSFFGDWLCQGSGELIADTNHYQRCNYADCYYHNPTWHWGFRHYVWMILGLTFLIINIVELTKDEQR